VLELQQRGHLRSSLARSIWPAASHQANFRRTSRWTSLYLWSSFHSTRREGKRLGRRWIPGSRM